jgi:anti-anti-sigma regulatory factor
LGETIQRMEKPLAIEVEHPAAGRAVVVFQGEHDLTQAEALREVLRELVAENDLVVDCRGRALRT